MKNKRNNYTVSAILIISVLVVSGCASNKTLYKDPNGLFSVEVPNGWSQSTDSAQITEKLAEKGLGITIVEFKKNNTSIGFVVTSRPQQAPANLDTNLLVSALQAQKLLPEGKQLQKKVFGGIEGMEIVLEGSEINNQLTSGASVVKAKFIFAVKNDKIITITYATDSRIEDFDKNISEAETIINSFKLLK